MYVRLSSLTVLGQPGKADVLEELLRYILRRSPANREAVLCLVHPSSSTLIW